MLALYKLHIDIKIVAGKNPAKELRGLNDKWHRCLTVVPGKNGETMFDGFDLSDERAIIEFEEVAKKYAGMENPGKDDGISYIRKGSEVLDPVMELTNGQTEGNVHLVLDAVGFEPMREEKFFILSGVHYHPDEDGNDSSADIITERCASRREAARQAAVIFRETFTDDEFTVEGCMYGNYFCDVNGEWVKLEIAELKK